MSTEASTGGAVQQSTGAPASTGGAAGSSGGSTGAAAFLGWGDDWRKKLAGDNADELKRLERFQGPENIYQSYRELEKRMSAGELKTSLPKNATAEETARWRTENGIPAKPDEYKINLPAGKQPPKEDDVFLKAFLKDAHDANYTQGQVDQAVKSFYAEVDRQTSAIDEAESELAKKTEDQLRLEWGADYRTNKAMAEALLTRAPAGFRDRFLNGYLIEKKAGAEDIRIPIKASPDAWKWLVQLEREINPAATVVPGAGGNVGQTIATEIAELKKLMAVETSEYWKGPKAEQHQARYRQLLEAEEKLKAKAA